MFLTAQDLQARLQPAVFGQLTGQAPTRIDDAIAEAVSHARDVLSANYDVDLIFSSVGPARHMALVGHVRALAIYHLYAPADDDKIPERVAFNYEQALAWLKDVGSGRFAMDLPRRPSATGTGPATRFLGDSVPPRRLL